MERNQELMKQLELQMRGEDLAQLLSRLAEQEGDLNEQTEQESKPNQQLAQEQDALKKSMESLMEKNMKELSQLDEKQQQTENLEATEEKGKEAGEEMDNSSQQLQQGQKHKASQAQQKAQKKLQEMSASMMQMAQSGNLQQIELDIKATRQLLTNLIRLSFDQEKLMNLVKITPGSSPVYLSNAQEQNRLSS